jgi:transcription termination factor NusB
LADGDPGGTAGRRTGGRRAGARHAAEREGRRLALSAIFEAEFGARTAATALARALADAPEDAPGGELAAAIVTAVTRHRALLRSALGEVLHCPATPVRVAISEWVELARTYSGEPARRLLNGVLGRVATEMAETAREP